MKKNICRALIEVGFIIFLFFLFYSNLLMGEFERSGMGQKRGVAWVVGDVSRSPILKSPWLPRLSVMALLNFFGRDSRQTATTHRR
jgi:hypothetical protein